MSEKQSQKKIPIYQIINLKDKFLIKAHLLVEIAIKTIILYIYFLIKLVLLLSHRNVIGDSSLYERSIFVAPVHTAPLLAHFAGILEDKMITAVT